MKTKNIRFCDVKAVNAPLIDELTDAVGSTMRGGILVLGEEVNSFETEAAHYLGSPHALAVASGTDALTLCIDSLDIAPGDEVLIPSMTFFAAAEAVVRAHAIPVPTNSLRLADLDAEITSQTRALIAPSLHGAAADLSEVMQWAEEKKLTVIEDACQAFGARYQRVYAGCRAHMGCFSFYPTKVLGGAGDGGLIVTKDTALAGKLRALSRHGSSPDNKYIHRFMGTNSRLDAVQAAFLRVKLRHLEESIAKRRRLAKRYYARLQQETWLSLPPQRAEARDTYYAFTIGCQLQKELRAYLADLHIEAPVHFPVPIHQQPAFTEKFRVPRQTLSQAELLATTLVSLPCHPALTTDEVDRVCDAVISFGAQQ